MKNALAVAMRLCTTLCAAPVPSGAAGGASVTTARPAFREGEAVEAAVAPTDAASRWRLADWLGRPVAEGGVANGCIAAGVLPPGYYRLSVETNGVETGRTTVPVVPDPAKTVRSREAFFGADAALSTLGRPGRYPCPWNDGDSGATLADLLWMSGVSHVRERLKWREVNPSPGVWRWGRFFRNAEMLCSKGLFVCDVFHDVADGVETLRRLPRSPVDVADFAAETARTLGGQLDALEIWNEEDAGADPVWDYVPVLRAAAWGVRTARPGLAVANGSLCRTVRTQFAEALAANGLLDATDALNLHTYVPLGDYPRMLEGVRDYRAAAGLGAKPVWFTEFGSPHEGFAMGRSTRDPALRVHTPAQELTVAEFWPKSQIAMMAGGVSRAYFFVFGAYHELGGRKDWGVVRPDDFTVKPVFGAMAQMTHALSGAVLAGSVDLGDPRLAGWLFRDGDGRETLVFWSKSPLDGAGFLGPDIVFAVPAEAGESYALADMMGTPRPLGGPEDGQLELVASRYPSYLTGRTGLSARPASAPQRDDAAARPEDAPPQDSSVIVRIAPNPDDFKVGGQGAVCELWRPEGRLRVEYWNLSDETKNCAASLSGGAFEGAPGETFAIPPRSCRAFDAVLRPETDGDGRGTLALGGTLADGRAVPPLVVLVRDQHAFESRLLAVPVEPARDRIRMQSSATRADVSLDGGTLSFHAAWSDPRTDRWIYPQIEVPGAAVAGAVYLEFEVRSSQDKPENDFRTTGGAFYDAAGNRLGEGPLDFRYDPPAREWETRRVELPPFAALPAHVRTALAADRVLLSLGGNPQGTDLTLEFRNIRFLRPKE